MNNKMYDEVLIKIAQAETIKELMENVKCSMGYTDSRIAEMEHDKEVRTFTDYEETILTNHRAKKIALIRVYNSLVKLL